MKFIKIPLDFKMAIVAAILSLFSIITINSLKKVHYYKMLNKKIIIKAKKIKKNNNNLQAQLFYYKKLKQNLFKKYIELNGNKTPKTVLLKIMNIAEKKSIKYNIDLILILEVISRESNFNIYAKGTVGEIGLMQILPRTAKWLKCYDKDVNELYNPEKNIDCGVKFLKYLIEERGITNRINIHRTYQGYNPSEISANLYWDESKFNYKFVYNK